MKNFLNQNEEVLKYFRVALFYLSHILILRYFFSQGITDPEGDAVHLFLSNVILVITIPPMIIITYVYEDEKSWRRALLVATFLIPTIWFAFSVLGGNPFIGR